MPKKQTEKFQNNNEIYNFYENKEVKKMTDKYENPNFNVHQIPHPSRIGVIGGSGTGKTSIVLNVVNKMKGTFGHIYIVSKAQEVLYDFLQKQLNVKGKNVVSFYTRLTELPNIANFPNKAEQALIIFDDLCNEKDQRIICEWFIRGRKVNKGVSLIYISQSYFKIPRLVRLQLSELFVLRLSSSRDLDAIFREVSLGDNIDKDILNKIYKKATEKKFNFLRINIDSPDPNKKFAYNFNNWVKLENKSYDGGNDSNKKDGMNSSDESSSSSSDKDF
jgi:hypothetical protein